MSSIDVEFDVALHSVSAQNAVAYRIIGMASCQIEKIGPKYVCHLTALAGADLHFIDLATDESLRERLSERTEPVRNLILSLAFGALTAETLTDH
jgi:hypothetical protein